MPRCLDFFRWAAGLAAVTSAAFAFSVGSDRWGGTTVTMHLQLGTPSAALLDGSTSWNTPAEDALALWNANITNLQFAVVRGSTAQVADGNGINNVFFSSTVYGDAWDPRTVAICLTHFNSNQRTTEADVLFNSTLSWNSYRGNLRTASRDTTLYDLRRVALHEFGHALGLNHPDENGQRVTAIMNAQTSDVDTLTADDIAGAKSLYDGPGSLASAPGFDGGIGYSNAGSNLNLRATRVVNEGNVTSNLLRLELWAMPQSYNNGLPAGSQRVGAYAFPDPLAAGAAYTNVSADTFFTPPTPGGTYNMVLLLTEFTGGAGSGFAIRDFIEFSSAATFSSVALPTLTRQPSGQPVNQGGALTLTVEGTGSPFYGWQRNGVEVPNVFSPSLTVSNLQPATTGVYQALVSNSAGNATYSNFAVVGLASTAKIVGDGSEVGTNILHANGNTFDQILLQGAATTFTADAGQITRLSFLDLQNDIVQVEFAGAGAVSLVLDGATGPAPPVNYNQPTVSYMKGHIGIVVTGANETTNLSVFSVGRGNAVNQALFKDVAYDGFANLSFIAISSANGKFGGLRTANAIYTAIRGLAGVYAPGVEFTGPVFVGDINASGVATPALVLGSGSDVRITGGDLLQTNGRAVQVGGITQLRMAAGSTSHFVSTTSTPTLLLAAQVSKARLEQNGVDVTAQVTVNP